MWAVFPLINIKLINCPFDWLMEYGIFRERPTLVEDCFCVNISGWQLPLPDVQSRIHIVDFWKTSFLYFLFKSKLPQLIWILTYNIRLSLGICVMDLFLGDVFWSWFYIITVHSDKNHANDFCALQINTDCFT